MTSDSTTERDWEQDGGTPNTLAEKLLVTAKSMGLPKHPATETSVKQINADIEASGRRGAVVTKLECTGCTRHNIKPDCPKHGRKRGKEEVDKRGT